MKALCLALLLVLTLQLSLRSHDGSNPLAGKTFTITDNELEITAINGIEVTFTEDNLSFHGCNGNFARYETEGKNFKVERWANTLIFCPEDNDEFVQQLFSNSQTFGLNENGVLSFYNEAGETLVTLQQN